MEFEKLKKIIAEVLNVDEEEISMETTFVDDLGADSLDVFQIIMGIEEVFDIEVPAEEAEKITNVEEAVAMIKSAINSSSETFWFLPPPQAGYPRSEVSKNMARGRFLCVRDVSFFLNIPPLTWLYIAASVAVNAVRTPSNVTYAIGSNNNL